MALTQIDDRGLKTPIDLLDNEKIRLGTGNDLELFHDGSASNIKDTGTGQINLWSNEVRMIDAGGSEYMFRAFENGAVELYHDNSKKLETTSVGVKLLGSGTDAIEMTGDVWFNNNEHAGADIYFNSGDKHLIFEDNVTAKFGGSADLQIYHDGSNSHIAETGTGVLKISGSAGVYINKYDNAETMAAFLHDAEVQLYHNNNLKFETASDGIKITGDGSNSNITTASGDLQLINTDDDINLYAADDIGLYVQTNEAAIKCIGNGAVELYHDNSKKLETTSGGAAVTGTTSISGNTSVGTTTQNWRFQVFGGRSTFTDTTAYAIAVRKNSAQSANHNFWMGGAAADDNTNPDLVFSDNSGSEKFRFRQSGGLCFNGDSAAANALDDYEEGTHTLVPNSNLTLNTNYNVAEYTKIGNVVTMTFLFFISSVSSNNTVTVTMPFAAKSGSGSSRCDAIATIMHNGVNTGTAGIVGYIGNGSSEMLFYNLSTNGGWAALNNSDLNANDEMYVTVTYRTA